MLSLLTLLMAVTGPSVDAKEIGASTTALSGMYELTVCHGTCVAGQVPRYDGVLVLLSEEIPSEILESLGWEAFPHKLIELPMNGCFRVTYRRAFDGSIFDEPLDHAELIHWEQEADGAIWIHLFRSPDAGYAISLSPGTQMEGFGIHWHAWLDMTDGPVDEVIARRISSAEVSLCAQPGRLTMP